MEDKRISIECPLCGDLMYVRNILPSDKKNVVIKQMECKCSDFRLEQRHKKK